MVALGKKTVLYDLQPTSLCTIQEVEDIQNMEKKCASAEKVGQNTMYKQLFVANEVLQGCLIHVRSLLEAASSSRDGIGEKDSAITLIVLDKSATMTLDEFKAIQAGQAEKALGQLNSLRNKIIDIVWESCATVAEMEGITHGIRQGGSKKVKIQAAVEEEPQKKMDSKTKLQKKFGIKTLEEKKKEEKSSKPLYAQIAEWRKILSRLAAFLKSIDYMILEMLRRLVVTAMRLLLEHLSSSYYVTDEDEEKASHIFLRIVHLIVTLRHQEERVNVASLEKALELPKKQVQAIVTQVQTFLDMHQVISAGPFLYAFIQEGTTDVKFFSKPQCLMRLARFTLEAHCSVSRNKRAKSLPLVLGAPLDGEQGTTLVIGIPPLQLDDERKNFFGKAFEQAAVSTNSRTLHDSFDTYLMEMKTEDRSKFFDALISLLN